MEDKLVINNSGNEVFESTCRLIGGKYYSIGNVLVEGSGDVFLINKRHIRVENLIYNHTLGRYTLPSKNLIKGIVSFDNLNNYILGYFEKNMLYNVILFDQKSEQHYCLNKSIIPLCYREELKSGNYFHISNKKTSDFNSLVSISREKKESLPYDSRGITDKFNAKFEKNYKPIITKNVSKYSKLLKDYTFGLEFETINGVLTEEKLEVLPLIPLRDGSISGLEYVTIPLKGEIGLQALIDSVEELKSKTRYDNSCALHYHIGGIPRTPEFLLAFYKVSSFFQEEIFSMFPLYKKYNFGVKRKNYSKPFPLNKINSLMDASIDIDNKEQINDNFNVLFKYLSEGNEFKRYNNDLNNVLEHPKDPNGNQKWNITNRYYANNLIPIIFGNKQTIEFRIHTPTYDIGKIINFLLFNIYIIDFTVTNLRYILKDPYYLVRINSFKNFINLYLKNVKLNSQDKRILINYHESYINSRLKQTEIANSLGNIEGDETKIKSPSSIKWDFIDKKDKKSFKENNVIPCKTITSTEGIHETIIKTIPRKLDFSTDYLKYINDLKISIENESIKNASIEKIIKKIDNDDLYSS